MLYSLSVRWPATFPPSGMAPSSPLVWSQEHQSGHTQRVSNKPVQPVLNTQVSHKPPSRLSQVITSITQLSLFLLADQLFSILWLLRSKPMSLKVNTCSTNEWNKCLLSPSSSDSTFLDSASSIHCNAKNLSRLEHNSKRINKVISLSKFSSDFIKIVNRSYFRGKPLLVDGLGYSYTKKICEKMQP
jgi:hypothetical protein